MSAVVRSTVRSRSEVLLKEAKWQQLALCTDQWAYTKTVLKSDCWEVHQVFHCFTGISLSTSLVCSPPLSFHWESIGWLPINDSQNIKEVFFPVSVTPSLLPKRLTIWQHKSIKYLFFFFFFYFLWDLSGVFSCTEGSFSQSVLSAIYIAIWRNL